MKPFNEEPVKRWQNEDNKRRNRTRFIPARLFIIIIIISASANIHKQIFLKASCLNKYLRASIIFWCLIEKYINSSHFSFAIKCLWLRTIYKTVRDGLQLNSGALWYKIKWTYWYTQKHSIEEYRENPQNSEQQLGM